MTRRLLPFSVSRCRSGRPPSRPVRRRRSTESGRYGWRGTLGPKASLALSLFLAGAGCSGADSGGWFRPRGERWTILCLEVRGVDCQASAEEIAAVTTG